jgi:hypothetical protein
MRSCNREDVSSATHYYDAGLGIIEAEQLLRRRQVSFPVVWFRLTGRGPKRRVTAIQKTFRPFGNCESLLIHSPSPTQETIHHGN